jgi:hypothetical protein
MMHYTKKEQANPNSKKHYKPNTGQFGLEAGLRQFGDKGEATVTRELKQFNTYYVFNP